MKHIDSFGVIVLAFEVVIVVLHALFSTYNVTGNESGIASDVARYPYFQDVHVMIFVGFGFLMTFLRKV